jgi:hypothetical protein
MDYLLAAVLLVLGATVALNETIQVVETRLRTRNGVAL